MRSARQQSTDDPNRSKNRNHARPDPDPPSWSSPHGEREMDEAERSLRVAAVDITFEPPASADAHLCLKGYFGSSRRAQRLASIPGESVPPRTAASIRSLIFSSEARIRRDLVGCGGLKCRVRPPARSSGFWTAQSARGFGIARRMLRKLEDAARDSSLMTVLLCTTRC